MTDVVDQFAKLTISHDSKPEDAKAWAEAAKGSTPGFDFSVVKTAVFKPKTPKGQEPTPVVLIALGETATPANVVAKSAGVKECRAAGDDMVAEFFDASPQTVGPFSLVKSASKIQVVLDSNIEKLTTPVAVRAGDEKTAFVETRKLLDFLKSVDIEPIVTDFSAAPDSAPKPAPKEKKAKQPAPSGKIEGAALIGITADKENDFPNWYSQVLTKGEMLDYYDVSGCYILRPNSYSIWERIQAFFNQEMKKMGVKNCSFPLFVSQRVLEKEKDHIEGFAPEVAWVTKAGNSDLEEPVAIRPTSETVMYPYYAKWIRSHRDLPLRLNQWNSVVRWEFKHPQPFLRTREFLWQESHCVYETLEQTEKEVLQALDCYADIYKELLACPVVKGHKTEKEKFAGSYFSTTVEGYIPATGRGIQGGTSHCLGQNFSKMFNITVEDPNNPGEKIHCWQSSFGLSTRVIGVMVMVHSDNKGLVLPPRVADVQSIVVPCGMTAKTTEEERKAIIDASQAVEKQLAEAGIRVEGDYRDNYTPGFKFADAEVRGIPLRVEMGPADMKKNQITVVRRDNGEKTAVSLDEVATKIPEVLEAMHWDMFNRAKQCYDDHRVSVEKIEDFVPNMNKKNLVIAPFCGREECEDDIKERTTQKEGDEDYDERAPSMGAKSLCIPFEQQPLENGTKCVGCGGDARFWTQFGRSY